MALKSLKTEILTLFLPEKSGFVFKHIGRKIPVHSFNSALLYEHYQDIVQQQWPVDKMSNKLWLLLTLLTTLTFVAAYIVSNIRKAQNVFETIK